MERQRARRKMDRTSKDANKNGVADKREGKDVSHKKMLSKGGSNKDGVRVKSRSANRSRNGKDLPAVDRLGVTIIDLSSAFPSA